MPPVSSFSQCLTNSIRLPTPDHLRFDFWLPQHCLLTYHGSYWSRLRGGCLFVQTDLGSEDRLASQNAQIPVGSTNRPIPEWLFPRRFLTKQRLTTYHPDQRRPDASQDTQETSCQACDPCLWELLVQPFTQCV